MNSHSVKFDRTTDGLWTVNCPEGKCWFAALGTSEADAANDLCEHLNTAHSRKAN